MLVPSARTSDFPLREEAANTIPEAFPGHRPLHPGSFSTHEREIARASFLSAHAGSIMAPRDSPPLSPFSFRYGIFLRLVLAPSILLFLVSACRKRPSADFDGTLFNGSALFTLDF